MITFNQLIFIAQSIKWFIQNGRMSKKHADKLMENIALQYELSPIYLW